MSDIGIFSALDLMVLALIGCAPGFVIGAGLGALVGVGSHPRRRLIGAAIFGLAGLLWPLRAGLSISPKSSEAAC